MKKARVRSIVWFIQLITFSRKVPHYVFVLPILMLFLTCCQEQDSTLLVGNSYEGGIIFYLDNTGQHGLVVAPFDQDSATWWNGTIIHISDSTSEEIGSGKSNTRAIVNAQGSGSYAAIICDQLVLNGYSDWFLPSYEELGLICQNLYHNNLGGFVHQPHQIYWSSSGGEANGDAQALNLQQNDGSCGGGKNPSFYKYRVRAVRAF